jgi:hypothetical protein
MGIFYLLHEYTERYHPDYPLGKKFARTIILGFIFYYIAYFLMPLYFVGFGPRIQHFLKYLIIVDIMSSSIFYGGILNSLSFWSTGKQMDEFRSVKYNDDIDISLPINEDNDNQFLED